MTIPYAAKRKSRPNPMKYSQHRRRYSATKCNWCANPITQQPTGRRRRWCSHSCRQRAYEYRKVEVVHDWWDHSKTVNSHLNAKLWLLHRPQYRAEWPLPRPPFTPRTPIPRRRTPPSPDIAAAWTGG